MSDSGILQSIIAEYRRYKALGDGALAQLKDVELSQPGPNGGNSIAVQVWHVSGNLASRFTDFLTSDGEKPWRRRDEEFIQRTVSRPELLKKWEDGWGVLFNTLNALTESDLKKTVTIRSQPLLVYEALHRSMAHAAYHVGQIVYVAKGFRGKDWSYLSIPPGGSQAYNQQPTLDKPNSHAKAIHKN